MPAEYRIVMAHVCTGQGRRFIHVIARKDDRLISLLITRRKAGEALASGSSEAPRFNIAEFQTSDYLVFLVSDMDPNQNRAALEAMSPQLQNCLQTAPQLGDIFPQPRYLALKR